MRFIDYYHRLSPRDKRAFAARCGTSTAYLSQLAHGHRAPGWRLGLAIVAASDGAITPHPDSFGATPTASNSKSEGD